tara:strand:- start:8981 stop:9505 length:525 start_codon:yes stop_codon:yes gene_type:complete
MRATISFEADIDKVNNIMQSLVLEETQALEEALNCMEGSTSDRLVNGINESLRHIYGVVRQLEQYRDMVASFERARLETVLPQPAQDNLGDLEGVRETLREAKKNLQGVDQALADIPIADTDNIPAPEPYDPSDFDPSEVKGIQDTITHMRKFADFIKGTQTSKGEPDDDFEEG